MSTAPARKGRNGLPPVTHCVAGHEVNAENSYVKRNGSRYCVICHRERKAARRLLLPACDIPHLDGSPWVDFAAAIVRQSIADYRGSGEDYESALEFLAAAGLLTRNGSIKRH